VHREPAGGAYGSVVVAARGDAVALLASPDVSLVVADVIR
jgi:hypothetical protein